MLGSVITFQEGAGEKDLFTRKRREKKKSLPAAGLGAASVPPLAAMYLCWNILRGGETSGS